MRAQERAPNYRVVAAWSGFLLLIGAGAFAFGMAIHNEGPATPPAPPALKWRDNPYPDL
jgi:hypothetical protein